MAQQKVLIDWPLTPYTGWGSYGIQLAQALLASQRARPVLTSRADRSAHCNPAWLLRLDEIEAFSAELIEYTTDHPDALVETNCNMVMEPMGNLVPPLRRRGDRQVGVAFFERSALDQAYLQQLGRFDLVITGSRWNQQLLESNGFERSVMIHQGVDACHFHSIAVPRLIRRPLVIFAGGKLEARKGQDLVIEAFRRLLRTIPDAMLIACWGNLGEVGLGTIGQCASVQGTPDRGDAEGVYAWLVEQGIPSRNLLVPAITANAQLPDLIKQADVAVFASRCEGGTNLMAMETLACGIPTVLSANTGHLDLLELGLEHAIAVGSTGLGRVPAAITRGYGGDAGGLWGETDPEELVAVLLELQRNQGFWHERGQAGAAQMERFSWRRSMQELLDNLNDCGLL